MSGNRLVNGRRNGEWTTHYENGKLERSENYLNDTLHGSQQLYYPSGQLHIKKTYARGVEVDSTICYHSNGQVNLKQFKDSLGRTQGLFKVYHANGQPSQIAFMKDGELDGESKAFFDNGQLSGINRYNAGEPVGTWVEFSRTGDTLKIDKY